ncbi:hypothetical protein ES708_28533 [subsurface metagenome]
MMEKTNIPDAEIFQNLVTTNLIDSAKGLFIQFHDRVKFRLDAARYFLNRLQKLEQKAGSLVGPGIKRRDVEFNLDAFLYEVVGTLDPLLQEINVAFSLGLELQDVEMCTIIPELPLSNQVKKVLGRLHGNTEGWFWKLREYRNHSAHRKIIGFTIFAGGKEDGKVYLHKDPLDTKKGEANEEVLQYCKNSITRMEDLINEMYKLSITELSSGKP